MLYETVDKELLTIDYGKGCGQAWALLDDIEKLKLRNFDWSVRINPDDPSVLKQCYQCEDYLAYKLSAHVVLYWSVVRKHSHLTSLAGCLPLKIRFHAIEILDKRNISSN